MTQVQSSAPMSYFPLKYKGKREKKVFLMHTLAAVSGQLVKDRQMLPNRDFPTGWKLAHIFRVILMLVRCL